MVFVTQEFEASRVNDLKKYGEKWTLKDINKNLQNLQKKWVLICLSFKSGTINSYDEFTIMNLYLLIKKEDIRK